jgi:hypothetical protein
MDTNSFCQKRVSQHSWLQQKRRGRLSGGLIGCCTRFLLSFELLLGFFSIY